MSAVEQIRAGICRIALLGEFDLSRRNELEERFDSVPPEWAVVVDLHGVTYIDSTFLNVLAHLYRRRSEGATVTLERANDRFGTSCAWPVSTNSL
jgi:anti-anti-sigma factor